MIEMALYIAFCVIGIIQYLKGVLCNIPAKVWAMLQPLLCVLLAFVWIILPNWIFTGILAFALSQIGYETIIQTIKKKISELTKREIDVLKMIASGAFNKEIALTLNISERTVKNHISNIFKHSNRE